MVKKLCDEVSKIKNLRWQFQRIFRWLCHGVLSFFCWRNFHGEICKTKWPHFTFEEKLKNTDFEGQISYPKIHLWFFSLGLSSRPVREDRFAPPNFDWGWKIRVLFIISLLPNITYYFIIIIQIQQHPLSQFSNTPDLHPPEVFWSFDPFKVKISFKLFLIFKST